MHGLTAIPARTPAGVRGRLGGSIPSAGQCRRRGRQMKRTHSRKRAEEGALSLLEYLLLAVLVIAAALAGMTFLGSTADGRSNKSVSPSSNTPQTKLAREVLPSGGGDRYYRRL